MSQEDTRLAHVKLVYQMDTSYTHTVIGYDESNRLAMIAALTYYPELQNTHGNAINPEILPGKINAGLWNRSLSAEHVISGNSLVWDAVPELVNVPINSSPTSTNPQWTMVPVDPAILGSLRAQAQRVMKNATPTANGTVTATVKTPDGQVISVNRAQLDNINKQASTGSNFFGWLSNLFKTGGNA